MLVNELALMSSYSRDIAPAVSSSGAVAFGVFFQRASTIEAQGWARSIHANCCDFGSGMQTGDGEMQAREV